MEHDHAASPQASPAPVDPPDTRVEGAQRTVSFSSQRSGYDPAMVDGLLARVAEAIETGRAIDPPLDSFTLPRKLRGYRRSEVDQLLAELREQHPVLFGRPPILGPNESEDLPRESAQNGEGPTVNNGEAEGQARTGTDSVTAEVPTSAMSGSEVGSAESPMPDVDPMLARLRAEADAFVEAQARRAATTAAEIIEAAKTEAAAIRDRAEKIEEQAQARAAEIEVLAVALDEQALRVERSLGEAAAEIATARQSVAEPGAPSSSSVVDLTDGPVELVT